MATAIQLNGIDNSVILTIPEPSSSADPEADYSILWNIALDGDGADANDRAIPLGLNSDPSIDTAVIHVQNNNEIQFSTRLGGTFAFTGLTGVVWTDYNDYEIVVTIASGATRDAELFINGVSKGNSSVNSTPRPLAFDRAGQTNSVFRTGRIQYVGMTDRITPANSRFFDVRGITAGSATTVIPETTGNGTDGSVTGTPNYVTAAAATNAIAVTTQDYRIWQRTALDNASVTINGAYTGTPTAIERSVDGGAWTTADAAPAGGTFADTFTLATGQYSIAYRFSNDVGVTDTVTFISVGDVFVGAGQSNMSGRGTNNQTYTPSAGGVRACLLGNDDNYKQLVDPTDDATGQIDQISNDLLEAPALANPTGSWWPRFVNEWLANSEIPIGFIPCALGATDISQWSKTSIDRISALNLYESMSRRINAVGGIKAVFYEQAEQDANNGTATTATTYESSLNTLVNDINTDFGVDTFIIPLHTITAAGYDGNGTTTGQAAIRQAQLDVASSNGNCSIGQALTDIDLSGGDGLHFQDDADLNTVGVRMYQSYTGSELALSITGMPDGTYKTALFSGTTEVFNGTLTYTSGAATTPTLSVGIGALLTGYVIDNNATPIDGAVIVGTTA